MLGYLAMGMIIGPYVAGRSGDEWLHFATVADVETVHTLAEIGVVLLVFAIGIEISFRELVSLGKVIVIGGLLQIAVTAALLTPIGVFLGFDMSTAIILGMVGALSSTMVVLKTLTDRGEIHSLHGRLLTGFLLMQDLRVHSDDSHAASVGRQRRRGERPQGGLALAFSRRWWSSVAWRCSASR